MEAPVTRMVSMLAAAAAAVGLGSLVVGCARDQVPPAESRAAEPVDAARQAPDGELPADPRELVRRVHACRLAGRYEELRALLVPEHRDVLIELVLSVDQLAAAEAQLRETVRRAIGAGSATRFLHREQVVNILGPLSRDVDVISADVSGDEAQVTIQVAGRVPLEQVRVVRRDGPWLLESDDPIPELATQIRNLARATRRVSDDVERRGLSVAQVQQELDLRHGPILKRISELTNAPLP